VAGCVYSCVTNLISLFSFYMGRKSRILERLARKWSTLERNGLTMVATWLRESITHNSKFLVVPCSSSYPSFAVYDLIWSDMICCDMICLSQVSSKIQLHMKTIKHLFPCDAKRPCDSFILRYSPNAMDMVNGSTQAENITLETRLEDDNQWKLFAGEDTLASVSGMAQWLQHYGIGDGSVAIVL